MSHRRRAGALLAAAALTVAAARGLAAQETAGSQTIDVEIQIATQIVERMPVGSASAFAAEVGQLYCWTRVTGAAGDTIQHVWIHGGDEFPVPLAVGSSPWRTWSSKVIPPEWSGAWRVEVRDASGNVLAAADFTVGQS